MLSTESHAFLFTDIYVLYKFAMPYALGIILTTGMMMFSNMKAIKWLTEELQYSLS